MLRAHYEDPAIVAVARYGCEFLADMLARTGSDPGFVNCGYLAVGEADREPRIRRAIEVMRAQGVVVEQLDNAQIRSLEPRLAAGALTIGAYEPGNGVCEPLFVADGFAKAAERLGARLAFGTRVTAVRPDGEGFLLLCADGRRISADRVAVCCGGFGPRLTRSLGGSLPVDLVRVQAGRFRPPFPFGPPGPIVSHHTLGIWLRPDGDDGHYLVGARADFLGRGPYRARSGQGGRTCASWSASRVSSRASSRAPPAASSAAPGRAGSTSRPTATPWSTSCRAVRACCSQAACRATPSSSARRSAWAQPSCCWTARSAPSTGRPSATAASTGRATRCAGPATGARAGGVPEPGAAGSAERATPGPLGDALRW